MSKFSKLTCQCCGLAAPTQLVDDLALVASDRAEPPAALVLEVCDECAPHVADVYTAGEFCPVLADVNLVLHAGHEPGRRPLVPGQCVCGGRCYEWNTPYRDRFIPHGVCTACGREW